MPVRFPSLRTTLSNPAHWPRLAGFAALSAPVLMWSEFLTMGTLRHGYNLVTGAASDLATRGTPNAAIFSAGFFFVPGILTVLVGAGLWFAHRNSRAWRVGAVLVGMAGVFLVLTGVFPQDPHSPLSGFLHGLVSQTCFVIATASMVTLAVGAPRQAPLSPPRRLWLGVAAAVVLIEAFNLVLRAPLGLPNGLFQRPFTLTLTAWFVVTGIWLLRGHQVEGLSVPA
jgi:hypothetical membrane protein